MSLKQVQTSVGSSAFLLLLARQSKQIQNGRSFSRPFCDLNEVKGTVINMLDISWEEFWWNNITGAQVVVSKVVSALLES